MLHTQQDKYYCCEDDTCVSVSCCLAGEHKVELLNETSEKNKEKLSKVLDKLIPERKDMEHGGGEPAAEQEESGRKSSR